MKKIKNIVVAIDFSATSRDAYRYSKLLAKSLDATLTVVNVRESIMMVSDVTMATFPIVNDSELIDQIEGFIIDENRILNISTKINEVKAKILRGNVVDELVELSKDDATDLIVIGTTGLSDVLTKIFGSTSVSLSNLAHCPVLLVPRGIKWEPIEQIMYASNYDSLSPIMVQEITEFAINTKADLHFVNVRNFDSPFDTKQKDFDWNDLFISKNPNFYYEKQTIYGNDTVKELIKYSTDKDIDMICFASNHRNFWQNLVHTSITENMAISSILPILILHLDDNELKS